MFPTASGYTKEQLVACKSVILELSRILGKYWQSIFIVGGFVPTLIANDPNDPHRGTLDVDLALNHLEIPEEAYATIHELLIGHGYRHNTEKTKQFQQRLHKNFASPDASGPADIANFLEAEDEADRDVIMRDAFETFKSLFDAIAAL